jgi:Transglutaminase-like superfamily
MERDEQWTTHTPMSDPGRYLSAISTLPHDLGLLIKIIQGLLVHADWAKEYGLDAARLNVSSRKTLSMVERLSDVVQRDARSLEISRPVCKRSLGTCRDFALMLCSILRCQGISSRLRCGFAAYFGGNWEDHWICEYWDAKTEMWRLGDAQIDQMLTLRKHIEFDPSNVPRCAFLTAGEAWSRCRTMQSDPNLFGHGDVTG